MRCITNSAQLSINWPSEAVCQFQNPSMKFLRCGQDLNLGKPFYALQLLSKKPPSTKLSHHTKISFLSYAKGELKLADAERLERPIPLRDTWVQIRPTTNYHTHPWKSRIWRSCFARLWTLKRHGLRWLLAEAGHIFRKFCGLAFFSPASWGICRNQWQL